MGGDLASWSESQPSPVVSDHAGGNNITGDKKKQRTDNRVVESKNLR
jgi:hypothetical protein